MRTSIIEKENDSGRNIVAGIAKAPGLIEIKNLFKTFSNYQGGFDVLKNINLTINPGEFIAVIGKSGSGKSTLLNMIAGLDYPTKGDVLYGSKKINLMKQNELAKWRGTNIGVVFQFFQLLPTLTILENVILPMDFCKTYPVKERKKRAFFILEKLQIADQANKLPSTLSGGQQQRAAIARALSNDPSVIVADEPTGNLDSKTAENVLEIFKNLSKSGKTVIMVSHENDLKSLVDRSIKIADGEIAAGDDK
jgi:putative ABC transport system ATP-binding protein